MFAKLKESIKDWLKKVLGITSLTETLDAAITKAAQDNNDLFQQLSATVASILPETNAAFLDLKTETAVCLETLDSAVKNVKVECSTELHQLEARQNGIVSATKADLESSITLARSDFESADLGLKIQTENLLALGMKNALSISDVRKALDVFIGRLLEPSKVPVGSAICSYCGLLVSVGKFEIRGKAAVCESCLVARGI